MQTYNGGGGAGDGAPVGFRGPEADCRLLKLKAFCPFTYKRGTFIKIKAAHYAAI